MPHQLLERLEMYLQQDKEVRHMCQFNISQGRGKGRDKACDKGKSLQTTFRSHYLRPTSRIPPLARTAYDRHEMCQTPFIAYARAPAMRSGLGLRHPQPPLPQASTLLDLVRQANLHATRSIEASTKPTATSCGMGTPTDLSLDRC